jgi:hypothetical protein
LNKERDIVFYRPDEKPVDICGIYKGSACFILANGPSANLRRPEFFKRPGVVTFGLNNGVNFWRPTLANVADPAHKFHHSIWLDPAITKFAVINNVDKHFYIDDKDSGISISECPNVVFYKRAHMSGELWMDENEICRGVTATDRNSFVSMFHLAYKLGFKRMYLWGCDFKMTQSNQYFFEEEQKHGVVIKNNNLYRKMNELLKKARQRFEDRGVTIYNCTPDSGLKAFDYMDIDKAIDTEEIKPAESVFNMYNRNEPVGDKN